MLTSRGILDENRGSHLQPSVENSRHFVPQSPDPISRFSRYFPQWMVGHTVFVAYRFATSFFRLETFIVGVVATLGGNISIAFTTVDSKLPFESVSSRSDRQIWHRTCYFRVRGDQEFIEVKCAYLFNWWNSQGVIFRRIG